MRRDIKSAFAELQKSVASSPLNGITEVSLKVEKDPQFNVHKFVVSVTKFGLKLEGLYDRTFSESPEWKELRRLWSQMVASFCMMPIQIEAAAEKANRDSRLF